MAMDQQPQGIPATYPCSIESENALLGSILLDNDAMDLVMDFVTEEDFYSELNRKIFACMKNLFHQNRPIDIATIYSSFDSPNLLADAGGIHYLTELPNTVPSATNAKHYALIVQEKSVLRQIIKIADEAKIKAESQIESVANFVSDLHQQIFSLSIKEGRPPYLTMREVVRETFSEIEALLDHRNELPGVSTGFADLDDMLAGFHPGQLIILAARPAMGKTALALNFLTNAAIDHQVPAAFFSLEMTSSELCKRVLSARAHIDAGQLRRVNINNEEMERLVDAVGHLSESPIYIDDTPALPITALQAKARRLKAEKGIGLIVIDYLQLMRPSKNIASREQEVSDISRNLKAIAKELELPIIALAQLSRAVEQRDDKRPLLSDLRESGSIEQDADVIMFIYRDDYYHPDTTTEKNIAEVIVAKQRSGRTGTAKLRWFGQFTLFENLLKETTNNPF